MLQHAEHLGLSLVVRHSIHSDELDAPRIAARCLLKVLALTLVHDQHDTIVHGRKLLIREAGRIHLKLGLTYVRLVLGVAVAAHA